MILQRLARNIRAQNWTAITIELLVLTLGVFLGLQAENWNQDRKDRADAQGYTQRLINDYEAIRELSHQSIDEIERELEALSILSEIAKSDGVRADTNYAALIQELRAYRVPAPRAASYLDILESNNLGLLDDSSLVDKLIRCDDEMQRFLAGFDIRREIVRERSGPLITLFLDIEDMSFQDAIHLIDTDSHSFRRAMAIHRITRQADSAGFNAIIDCSTRLIDTLRMDSI
jgi:hypothetical protein